MGDILYSNVYNLLFPELGDECTNKNGIVGFCQYRSKCQRDTDLGAICNSKQTIICCAKNVLRNKHFVSSDEQKEDRSIQPPFGFNPDFFHAPVLQPNPITNINFFNYQKQKTPNFVANVLHQSSNTMEFVEDRPYQNYEQGEANKPNKNRTTTSIRPTNEYGFYSSNNNKPNSINENIMYGSDQITNIPQNYYNYPNHETQRPVIQNQNNNFNRPNYFTNPQVQNNNKHKNTVPQRPNYNQYDNQPHQETHESNQNNNPNYYTTTKKPQYIYKPGNNENNSPLQNGEINQGSYEENKRPTRPSQSTNHKTSSSILFPDDLTDTPFTTTTKKYYEYYENRPNENNKRISEKSKINKIKIRLANRMISIKY